MSAMKRLYEDVIELTMDAIHRGANNVNDVVVYVNTQSPLRVDEDVIQRICDDVFAWYDDADEEYISEQVSH